MNAIVSGGEPFPLRVQHHPDEPAHGLLLRTIERNGSRRFWKMYKRLGVLQGRSVHNIEPHVIAAKCGADLAGVEYATARFDDTGHSGFTLLGQRLLVDHWSGYHRRWCPLCLEEEPYHRAWWDLSVITTCTDHGVELVSACPCQDRLTNGVQGILACRNDHDLRALEPRRIDFEEQAAERFIMDRLRGKEIAGMAVLEGVSLGDALYAMEWLGKFRLQPEGRYFETRKALGLRRLINEGYRMLEDFPRVYDDFLDGMVAGHIAKARSDQKWGMGHMYAGVHRFLTTRVFSRPDDLIAQRLKARLDEHAGANILLKSGYLVDGEPVIAVTLRDTAEKCGMGFETFVRIGAKLKLISWQRGKGKPHRVTQEEADAIIKRFTAFISMEQASQMLGVASERVIDLVDDGLIPFIDRPYDRSVSLGKPRGSRTNVFVDRPSNRWFFDPDAVPQLLNRFEGLVDVADDADLADLMPLPAVNSLYTQLARAVRLVLERKLSIRGVDNGARGLASLLVSRSEAAAAFKLDRRGGHFALRDAAPLMGLNYNQLNGCVKAGLVVPLGSGKAIYLTRAQIDEFVRTYMRAGELAERFGWNCGSRVVIRHMREVGLEPVSGKQDVGVTLYRRDAVEPVAAKLPVPTKFANISARVRYQKANGLEVAPTRRRMNQQGAGDAVNRG